MGAEDHDINDGIFNGCLVELFLIIMVMLIYKIGMYLVQ